MKNRICNAARTSAPILLLFAISTVAFAQTGNAGLDRATTFAQTLLTWLRNVALIVFVGSLVWGCIECAAESWREGRGKVFTSIACGIIAGVAQAVISGVYSNNG